MGTDSFGVMSRLAAPALKSSDGSCAWLKEENVKQETMSHQLRAEKFTRTTLHAGRRNVNFLSPVSNGGEGAAVPPPAGAGEGEGAPLESHPRLHSCVPFRLLKKKRSRHRG